MPKTFLEVETVGGGVATFDVDDAAGVGPERVSREGSTVVAKLDEPLDQALATARPAAQSIIDTFRALSPDELSIEFGLRIDAQAGAVFAKAGIGAHFNITVKWQPSKAEPSKPAPHQATNG